MNFCKTFFNHKQISISIVNFDVFRTEYGYFQIFLNDCIIIVYCDKFILLYKLCT